jgi:F-type H+-transporting ATPase subunit b
MEILKNFGVQPTLLFGQIVNFLIILFLLRKFFYGKILKILDDRKKTIEESLKNADLIELRLKETEEKSTKILNEAQNQAQKIILEAKMQADQVAKQASADARKTIDAAVLSARSQIEAQKQKMEDELQEQTLTLVTKVVQKILSRNLKETERNDLTKQALGEIGKRI